jgi:tRNA dimethylallyltransferase
LAKYGTLSRTAFQAVGYRETIDYVKADQIGSSKFNVQSSTLPESYQSQTLNIEPGTLNSRGLAACIERVKARTRQFARRQETWFRSLCECKGVSMREGFEPREVAEEILSATKEA